MLKTMHAPTRYMNGPLGLPYFHNHQPPINRKEEDWSLMQVELKMNALSIKEKQWGLEFSF